ncbi:MAG: helix-turn-helix transcriptional regulator [Candidatus Obscuribacterales bacterium]|nr:helix-turn-helix transcriptional regulator [Candidatus Obscuribacterales bacterium]
MSQEYSFGKYLKTLRKTRGYASVNDYLSAYCLPISEAYYRDLEAGRNKASLDMAGALCRALKAEPKEFYLYLLHEVLPEDIASLIVRPENGATQTNLCEVQVLVTLSSIL